jgi:hypothetical protein
MASMTHEAGDLVGAHLFLRELNHLVHLSRRQLRLLVVFFERRKHMTEVALNSKRPLKETHRARQRRRGLKIWIFL